MQIILNISWKIGKIDKFFDLIQFLAFVKIMEFNFLIGKEKGKIMTFVVVGYGIWYL